MLKVHETFFFFFLNIETIKLRKIILKKSVHVQSNTICTINMMISFF